MLLIFLKSKVKFEFKHHENGKNYTIHIDLVDKVRSCRRKLGIDTKISQGDDITIDTSDSLFKTYRVEMR